MRALPPLLVACSISIVACNPFAMWGNATSRRGAAEAATARFHVMLDSAEYETIWNEADPELRNTSQHDDAIALFRMVNRRFGPMEGMKLVGWNVNYSTSNGTLVRLQYRTGFARDSATETFVWRLRGDQPTLLNYNINSPALLRAMVEEKD